MDGTEFEILEWIVGLFGTLILALVVAFRHLTGKMSAADSELGRKISAGDRELHKKIDRVKDDYVRRDDLKEYLEPIRANQERTNEKLDRLIEVRAKRS